MKREEPKNAGNRWALAVLVPGTICTAVAYGPLFAMLLVPFWVLVAGAGWELSRYAEKRRKP